MTSTENEVAPLEATPVVEISITDLTALLIKENKIHEGRYQLAFKVNTTVGTFGLEQNSAFPGIMTQITAAALMASPEDNPISVDAAEVNPRRPSTRRKTSSKE